MLTLLSGSSIYRISVTVEVHGQPVTVDFHLRTSGGVDWSPYLTPEHNAMLGQYFSTLDRVVYEKFLFLILEVRWILKMIFVMRSIFRDFLFPFSALLRLCCRSNCTHDH